LLTREEADLVILRLSPSNRRLFDLIFMRPTTHLELTPTEVVRVAQALQDQINEMRGQQDDFLLRAVMQRVHIPHHPAYGDRLPRHYLDILRFPFVMYGIVPADWAPTTREDLAASSFTGTSRR
jgi:hypothetical protein